MSNVIIFIYLIIFAVVK